MKKIASTYEQKARDYEQVIKEQRERIITLRDENSLLKKDLDELKTKKEEISRAILSAEKSKTLIIEEAKKRAEQILLAAKNDAKQNEQSVRYYCNSLYELEVRCERILEGISRELKKTDRASLKLVK